MINKIYKIGNREFNFSKPYVMGILNVTPDSFSDPGLYLNIDDAVRHGLKMMEEGADIIDIGGESTKPGSEFISEEEELKRVVPVIEKILKKNKNAIISVDTTKSAVAEKCLKSGAKIVNDISGLTFDEKIIKVVRENNAALVIMHIKGQPKDMQKNPYYNNVIKEVFDFLKVQSDKALNAGIKNIILDPGIGFGKRTEDNFELIKNLNEFNKIGFPLMVGVSRKSFLGKTLNLEIGQRETATAITEAMALKNGARIIRTHNVKNGVQVCKLFQHLN